MKTFVELVQEIKKSFDKEDKNVLANIESSSEATSTASTPHAVGTRFTLGKTVYRVISAISTGDTIEEGVNVVVEDDIYSKLDGLGTAAVKDSTNEVTSGSTDLVESGAVASELATIASSIQTLEGNDEAMLNDLGAKNLLPNNAVSQTINGVTFTVNSDGTVTVSTGSGGATSLAQFILFESVANWHNMILSGAPSTASATTYDLAAYDTQTSEENSCRPNDAVLTNITDGHTIRVFIRVRSGQVITNPITFKPMIRPASIGDNTYVPYAMTNRELTEQVNGLIVEGITSDSVTIAANSNTTVYATITKSGYTPIGIMGIRGFSSEITPYEWNITSGKTQAYAGIKNRSSSSVTGALTFNILYKKS